MDKKTVEVTTVVLGGEWYVIYKLHLQCAENIMKTMYLLVGSCLHVDERTL